MIDLSGNAEQLRSRLGAHKAEWEQMREALHQCEIVNTKDVLLIETMITLCESELRAIDRTMLPW